jgi:hypothetical protein
MTKAALLSLAEKYHVTNTAYNSGKVRPRAQIRSMIASQQVRLALNKSPLGKCVECSFFIHVDKEHPMVVSWSSVDCMSPKVTVKYVMNGSIFNSRDSSDMSFVNYNASLNDPL